jgi:UDP-glucose 4-epimerase
VRSIAVTGGGGFLGAATVEYARKQGYDAWSFDRANGDDVLGNLDRLTGADHIIHLAGMLGTAELFDTAEQAVEANVIGTLRILQWCREHHAGYTGITMPDSNWANVYQATKLCSMRLASAWHRSYGVMVSHVRAFNAFGPGQKHGPTHPQKIIPAFATYAWAEKPIPVWGSGLQTVDLVYSGDVARMLVEACEFGDDDIFDAGTGVATTVMQVASMVNRICGRPLDSVEHLAMRKGETPESDIVAKGEGWELLDWRPTLNLEELRETVEWYRP